MRGDVGIAPYDFCVIYGIGVGADDHISPLTHKNHPNPDDRYLTSDNRYQWPPCPPVKYIGVICGVLRLRADVGIGPYDFCVIYGIGVGADDHISASTHKRDPNPDDCIPISYDRFGLWPL